MSFNAARPLNPWRWLGLPAVLCLVASLVFATPIRVFGLQLPEPVFAMVPAFAWGVIRPSMLAPFVLLLIGVLLDALWGSSLGLWGLSLLIAYAAVLFTRSWMSGQSPPIMWAWYVAVTGLALLAAYLFTMMDAKGAASPVAMFWQLAWTAILYPFAHQLIGRFEDADVRFK
jgi:rod shape-determining protein MreD